jgi:N-acetylglucosamine kinase-like BadF-type ATPase
MTGVLAVDLGKTGCRVALWTEAGRFDAQGPGAAGLAARNGAVTAEYVILAVARPLLQEAGLTCVATVAIGAPGALSAPAAAQVLAERLLVALPARRLAITSDAVTSHAGALAGEPGVVLAVGTGAVAIGVGGDGAFTRVDGCGPWLGDDGSGAWLGLAGLRSVLRAEDGRGPPTSLCAAALARFGAIADLPAVIGSDPNPARQAARFAGDVIRSADSGDAVAGDLLAQAVRILVTTTRAAVARCGLAEPVPVALIGGLLDAEQALRAQLQAQLLDGPVRVQMQAAAGSALDGGRLLAERTDTIHEARLLRVMAA